MSELRSPKATIEKVFSIVRYDARSGKWKHKTKAAEQTGLSRPTIDKIIEKLPHGLPQKLQVGQPRYYEAFEHSDAWQRLRDHKYAALIKATMVKAFKLLAQREPLEWTDQDIRDLRKPTITRKGLQKDNELFDSVTKDIQFQHAVNIRRALHGLSLYMLEKPLENVPKRPHGVRQTWFLENSDIVKFITGCKDVETLLFIVLGLQCGARPISMVSIKVSDINWTKNFVQYYESKKRIYVPRKFSSATMELLKKYIYDKQLGVQQRLFSKDQRFYTDRMKEIGFEQGIELLKTEGAGAYVLRHTFATQASEHDVSMEVVMKQGAWTDASTLMNHYLFIKESKMDRELLGIVTEKPLNFGEWIRQFTPIWEGRYEQLRGTIRRG